MAMGKEALGFLDRVSIVGKRGHQLGLGRGAGKGAKVVSGDR